METVVKPWCVCPSPTSSDSSRLFAGSNTTSVPGLWPLCQRSDDLGIPAAGNSDTDGQITTKRLHQLDCHAKGAEVAAPLGDVQNGSQLVEEAKRGEQGDARVKQRGQDDHRIALDARRDRQLHGGLLRTSCSEAEVLRVGELRSAPGRRCVRRRSSDRPYR